MLEAETSPWSVILFDQSALVYASWILTLLVALYLGRTRWGLNVRAVGEAPASADAMGVNVTLYRYVHVMVGGGFASSPERATACRSRPAGRPATRSSAARAGSRSRS